ncbi:hypothetical protein VTJ83DRAFT_3850 [Remersonia thermophila]|uniref:Micro-fibrillar-associated protein 1 C-terminal domain-containing protein n=1 Tax=Remersonia thermophila TaxID=72144 RepID=A0ABR4DFC2_9PEZI
MPPPPTQKRMTANPARPARHRAGKAVGPESSSDSDSDDDNDDNAASDREETKKAPPRRAAPPPRFATSAGPGRVISRGDGAKINLAGVGLGGTDRADDEARRQAARKAREEAERKAREEGFVTEEDDDDDDDEEEDGSEASGSGSEQESESDESESEEEEAPRRLMMRPKFIPKSQRQAQAQAGGAGTAASTTTTTPATAAAVAPTVHSSAQPAGGAEDTEARRRAADELVEEQIRKDLAARRSGKKHWESSSASGSDAEAEVDDTDDVDPEAEHAAWKLRELKRLRRERDAIEARERERAELERRRGLTEEERRAEDEARLAAQRDEKEGRGKMAYMQRYFHRGAFYTDQAAEMGLDKRDVVGARFADDVDRSLLPKALQMRDLSKIGKKGATKYRDLKSEDTGQWGGLADGRRSGGGGWDRAPRDVDERFRPDDDFRRRREGGDGAKGANAIPLGERRDRDRDRDRHRDGSRSRDGRRDDASYRRRDDGRDRPRRSRSRSRSPRSDRRKRSPSRERGGGDGHGYEGDKRRRVDAR